MGKLVSKSLKPPLPLSMSPVPNPWMPSLPNARADEALPAVSHGLDECCCAWLGERGGEVTGPAGDMERRPSCGGGERALLVSGD